MTSLKRYSIITLMASVAAGLTSCGGLDDYTGIEGPFMPKEDQADESPENGENDPSEDEFTEQLPTLFSFNITFQLDEEETATRGVNGYDGAETGIIGTGSMIDYLIFAIYDGEGNLLTRFAEEANSSITIGGKSITAGPGQNLLPWEGKNINIQLSSLSEGDYRMVCWAQSSACNAYTTTDLSDVKVSYTGALNNDESRDAFCASEAFTASEETDGGTLTVILKRPLAQVNVGTTGADYKNTAITPGGTYYTYSALKVKGVSTSINVITNQIGGQTVEAELGFTKIPAYHGLDIPKENADLVQSAGEQFLKIHLNDPSNTSTKPFAGYLTEYPTVKTDENGKVTEYLTETFKYLSMSYLLVSGKTTLDNVKIMFANDPEGKGFATYREILNVPVERNWRTNIIGGLYKPSNDNPEEDPKDPNNPDEPDEPTKPDDPIDDPSSIFKGVSCIIQIEPAYFDSNNKTEINEFNTIGNKN